MSGQQGAGGADRGPLPLLYTFAAVAVTVAFIGFISGTRDPGPTPGAAQEHESTTIDEMTVPEYRDVSAIGRGPNAGMYEQRLARGLPGLTDEVKRDGDLAGVRAKRASRRAYDGAPPTIPHAVEQTGAPSCLACHGAGAKIGDKIAPAMSHRRYSSCTQCHVPQQTPLPNRPPAMLAPNSFRGLPAATTGTRAWGGAPPTIPHKVFMRERCASCHGVSGANPIRSTHPYRQSCQQCHVPDSGSAQDQPRLESALRGWGGEGAPKK